MSKHATTARPIRRVEAAPAWGHRGAIQVLVRVVLMLLVLEAVLIVVFRLQVRPAIDAIRRFNRAVLNPAMMKLAGSSHWYASVIHHQGRASGRSYATPVVVEQAGSQLLHPAAVWPYRLVRQRDGCGRMHCRTQGQALSHRSADNRSVRRRSAGDLGAVTAIVSPLQRAVVPASGHHRRGMTPSRPDGACDEHSQPNKRE